MIRGIATMCIQKSCVYLTTHTKSKKYACTSLWVKTSQFVICLPHFCSLSIQYAFWSPTFFFLEYSHKTVYIHNHINIQVFRFLLMSKHRFPYCLYCCFLYFFLCYALYSLSWRYLQWQLIKSFLLLFHSLLSCHCISMFKAALFQGTLDLFLLLFYCRQGNSR